MRYHMRSKIIGLLLVVGGIGYLGEQFELWSFSIFFPGWWTLILIIPAICNIFENGWKITNAGVLVLGVYLLLKANGYIDFHISTGLLLALIFIFYGIRMIIGNPMNKEDKHRYRHSGTKDNASNLHISAICKEKRVFVNGYVNSVHAESICGNLCIELSEADIRNTQFFRIHCVVANIDIIVPEACRFVVEKDCALGVIRVEDSQGGSYDLHLEVSCIAGCINLRRTHR